MDIESLSRALVGAASVPELAARSFSSEVSHGLGTRCPHVRLDEAAFARHVTSLLDRSQRGTEALGALNATELALSFACAQGDRAALSWFDREVLPGVRPAVARIVGDGDALQDVLQLVRARLLLPDGSDPSRLMQWAGEGPLIAWVRAAAVRVALNATRGRRTEIADDEALQAAPAALDVDVEAMKALYREPFERAFRASLAELSAKERTLLKLHFVDGLSMEQIGAMYRTHKSTVSRWLASARGALLDATRQRLEAALGIRGTELRSLVRLVRSQLNLDLSRLLRE